MIKVGIQGERGSACDAVAGQLISDSDAVFVYLSDADKTLSSLRAGKIDLAVIAAESPVGSAVMETQEAIARHGDVVELRRLDSEVRHVILVNKGVRKEDIKFVASHEIPLTKHRKAITEYFPGYSEVQSLDTGVAARDLADGKLSSDTAVIAMRHAAAVFNLEVLDLDLPANDGYLTRFLLVKSSLS